MAKAHQIVLKVPSEWRGVHMEISEWPLSLSSLRLYQCKFYRRFFNGEENSF